MKFLLFNILSFILGGMFGVTLMCLFQINRKDE